MKINRDFNSEKCMNSIIVGTDKCLNTIKQPIRLCLKRINNN